MFTVRNDINAGPDFGADTVALPLMGQGGGGGERFADQWSSQLHGEVRDFIENGSDSWASLSPEGAWARQRVQDATLGGSMPYGADRQAFLDSIAPYAQQAAAKLGVAPELVSAHAALESGWGQHPLLRADGGSNHNLFGIKAGKGWQGEVTRALTTEHVDGRDVKRTESFRAYSGLQDAFADYAQLLAGNPRYRGALGVGGNAQAFAQALAQGGYATDPGYADKLRKVAAGIQARKQP
ncbi:glucosaminidase domain-containing protein [Chromobacterium haemolyticum]|uniref:glucosaminidase domain-containing protein n=1 Tax=Chromobacterium TaxID=535 RepID=UPI004057B058